MKKSFPRGDRIGAAVQRFVAEIIRDDFPDLAVTIVGAKSADRLQFVRVFYQGAKTDFSKILGHIRRELARRMDQKFVPELDFQYDDTLERAERIEELIKEVRV